MIKKYFLYNFVFQFTVYKFTYSICNLYELIYLLDDVISSYILLHILLHIFND